MSLHEDAITTLYESESRVPNVIHILHPTETLFLDWADYVNILEQLLGERHELEAEGVTVEEDRAPTADELHELRAWLEGVGTK